MTPWKIKAIKKTFSSAEENELLNQEITLKAWVKTVRKQKSFTFIEINDGSSLSNLQIVVDSKTPDYQNLIEKISTGCSICVKGKLIKSPGKNQSVEMQTQQLSILGECDPESYPLQKKRHSFEFLRTIAHLRPRTNTLGAVARIRSTLSHATHDFFKKKDFIYLHTPIITASDCEGAGELFRVTTLNGSSSKTKEDSKDYSKDFFEKPAYLTVSGQLNAEIYACALSNVYTFGPTFRAENSNTSRHLAEFWMIEPEMAFANLEDDMCLAEEYLKSIVKKTLDESHEDLELFNKFIDKSCLQRLEKLISEDFARIEYTQAIDILKKANKKFEFTPQWGHDLQSEHERFLAEEHFKKPVIVYNYPKEIKAFYMRENEDQKTVAAMDILVPKIGELVGGSQREERLDVLENKLKDNKLPIKNYWWYLDLRRYGSVPHAGFGLGFERLVQFVTGMDNIRDVIPFPRYPGNAEF